LTISTPRSHHRFTRRTALKATFAPALGLTALLAAQPVLASQATPASTPIGGSLTIYCGRNERLVSDLMPLIQDATGIELDVRFGNSAELAAQILEEGENSPAGLFFVQDAGPLGALAKAGRFIKLPDSILEQVKPEFRSRDGVWVGTSGRIRVLIYNPNVTDPATLPESILDLPRTPLNGPIGITPTNAPFQSFITAMRLVHGEDAARKWLEDIIATDPIIFDENEMALQAVANEEIAIGLVNHYYIYEARAEDPEIPVENYYFPNGDVGSLVNVGGVGVLDGSGQEPQALAVTEYLLGTEAQTYFQQQTFEYPLAGGVEPMEGLPPLDEIEAPPIDLSDLDDLEGTLNLLTEVGLI